MTVIHDRPEWRLVPHVGPLCVEMCTPALHVSGCMTWPVLPVHPCGVLADGTTRTPRAVNYDYATGATRPQEYVTCPECIAADAAHRAACARAR